MELTIERLEFIKQYPAAASPEEIRRLAAELLKFKRGEKRGSPDGGGFRVQPC